MTNRIKLTRHIIATRTEAEAACGEVCRLTLDRNALQTEMDTQLTAVREKYETRISTLKKDITDTTALIESWAASNPDEFPTGRKSIEMVHGRIGYRTGTPKLSLVRGQKWENVLGLLKSIFNGQFVRVKEEVAKDEILSAHAQHEINEAQMRQLRISVTQEESFFFEPKLEDTDTRTTQTVT